MESTARTSPSDLREKIQRLSDHTKRTLQLPYDPFETLQESGGIRIWARGITGQIRIAGTDVSIYPKYVRQGEERSWPRSLFRMLQVSQSQAFVPQGHVPSESGPQEFLDLVAYGYVDALNIALARGVPQSYKEVEEFTPYLRGRMDPTRLYPVVITRPNMLFCRSGEMSTDIPLNRLLKWTCLFLSTRVLSRALSRELEQVSLHFEDVPPLLPPELVGNSIRLSGPQIHFYRAYTIARWLALGRGFQFYEGTAEIPGIILQSNQVFQDFVSGCLSRICRRRGGWTHKSLQYFQFACETGSNEKMETVPDECLFEGADLKLVIDAKYKGEAYKDTLRPASSDVYQVLTAARAAHAAKCMLVYPRRPQAPLEKWEVSGIGNPRHLFLLGIDPILLSERNGIEEVSSHIEDSIGAALSS